VAYFLIVRNGVTGVVMNFRPKNRVFLSELIVTGSNPNFNLSVCFFLFWSARILVILNYGI
jgi:hypothetical protein